MQHATILPGDKQILTEKIIMLAFVSNRKPHATSTDTPSVLFVDPLSIINASPYLLRVTRN